MAAAPPAPPPVGMCTGVWQAPMPSSMAIQETKSTSRPSTMARALRFSEPFDGRQQQRIAVERGSFSRCCTTTCHWTRSCSPEPFQQDEERKRSIHAAKLKERVPRSNNRIQAEDPRTSHLEREAELLRRREELRKRKEAERAAKEEEELRECTFRPLLVTSPRLRTRALSPTCERATLDSSVSKLRQLAERQSSATLALQALAVDESKLWRRLCIVHTEIRERIQRESELQRELGTIEEAGLSPEEMQRRAHEAFHPAQLQAEGDLYARRLALVQELEAIEAQALTTLNCGALLEKAKASGIEFGLAEHARRSLPSLIGEPTTARGQQLLSPQMQYPPSGRSHASPKSACRVVRHSVPSTADVAASWAPTPAVVSRRASTGSRLAPALGIRPPAPKHPPSVSGSANNSAIIPVGAAATGISTADAGATAERTCTVPPSTGINGERVCFGNANSRSSALEPTMKGTGSLPKPEVVLPGTPRSSTARRLSDSAEAVDFLPVRRRLEFPE